MHTTSLLSRFSISSRNRIAKRELNHILRPLNEYSHCTFSSSTQSTQLDQIESEVEGKAGSVERKKTRKQNKAQLLNTLDYAERLIGMTQVMRFLLILFRINVFG